MLQDPMSSSMQLHYIPVSASVFIESYIHGLNFPGMSSSGSAMTNRKKPIDVTQSLDRNCPSFTKEKV